jgi:arabinan endo-1,5-alpha-L-arabinosidase
MRLRLLVAAAIALSGISGLTAASPAAEARAAQGTYTNPLDMSSEVGPVENCADPTVAKGKNASGNWRWYMYCTKDPRNDEDRTESGDLEFQLIPIYSSKDLVKWTYRGNVFQEADETDSNYPDWAQPTAGLFAPEIKKMNGQWYLYYSVTDVTDETSGEPGCNSDNAIGVATAATPLGPWTDSGDPVIDPRRGGGGCNFFWTIDPEIQTVAGQRYIFWGSYYGGVFARELSFDGLESNEATQVRITPGNKYEGPEIIRRGGYYYLFLSAANCCNGPLTGYSVFVGRSPDLLGPYVDRSGVSLNDEDDGWPQDSTDPTDGRIGGSVFLTMNGNQYVGPGHNTVFNDFAGRWWTIYHAIDDRDPYFAGTGDVNGGFTKRPALMDPISWENGWPKVRGGRWASSGEMPAPAAQPGQTDRYRPMTPWRSTKGTLLTEHSDEFEGSSLDPRWSWIREPDSSTYSVSGGLFRMDTQAGDIYGNQMGASVLVQDSPEGEFLLEARVRTTVPSEGCCFNFRQGGVLIYGDDDHYLKLVHASIWETRQVEWAKEVGPEEIGPFYGNSVVGPPGEWTTLRIVKADHGGGTHYQAWSRRDGGVWERGGTWRYDELGDDSLLGLVSMGRGGPADASIDTELEVDWFRVYDLRIRGPRPITES